MIHVGSIAIAVLLSDNMANEAIYSDAAVVVRS